MNIFVNIFQKYSQKHCKKYGQKHCKRHGKKYDFKVKKKAFSLIELSIVILIVGVLIAAITQTSVIVNMFRINSARTLTQSSPVQSLNNLVLWYDATSLQFKDADDNAAISSIIDSNPNSTIRSNAATSPTNVTTSTTYTAPKYKENCINGLPCFAFKRSERNALTVRSDTNYYNGVSPAVTNNFSIFFVAQTNTVHSVSSGTVPTATNNSGQGCQGAQNILLKWDDPSNMYSSPSLANYFGVGVSLTSNILWVCENDSASDITRRNSAVRTSQGISSAPMAVLVEYDNRVPKLYVNSIVNPITGTANAVAGSSVATPVAIGGTYHNANEVISTDANARYFEGSLGEVIIISGVLEVEDKKEIMNYLKKKWKING